jgi:hypothetical protein
MHERKKAGTMPPAARGAALHGSPEAEGLRNLLIVK